VCGVSAGGELGAPDGDAGDRVGRVQNHICHCAPLAVWRSFVYGRLGGCFGVD
jgi:hypothetical protein